MGDWPIRLKPLEPTVTVTPLIPSPPTEQGIVQETAAGPPPLGIRGSWRAVGIGLTSCGTPVGVAVASHLLAVIVIAIELTVALTIASTALFGSEVLSERAFRLLRWATNCPEPPAP